MVDLILPKVKKEVKDFSAYGNQLLYDPKIRKAKDLGNAFDAIRKTEKIKIGVTNGKYRVLTAAHCAFLGLAKRECDILVVAVNSDYSLRQLKEITPFSDRERAFAVANISFVDYVVLFDEETPYLAISEINPDLVLKGADYENKDVISAGKPVVIIKHGFEGHASDLF